MKLLLYFVRIKINLNYKKSYRIHCTELKSITKNSVLNKKEHVNSRSKDKYKMSQLTLITQMLEMETGRWKFMRL